VAVGICGALAFTNSRKTGNSLPACDTHCSGPATIKRPASDTFGTFATLGKQKLTRRNFGTITYGLIVPTHPAQRGTARNYPTRLYSSYR
jgi:hypothetical protein